MGATSQGSGGELSGSGRRGVCVCVCSSLALGFGQGSIAGLAGTLLGGLPQLGHRYWCHCSRRC